MTDSIDISRCLVKVIFCAVLIHPFLPTLAFSPAPSVNPSLFPQAVCPWPQRLRAQRKYLPGPNANVHSSLVGDENEDQSTKMLPSKVALGLKGLVVAGTAYGLALLYTGPKIETELRQGPEMQGLKVGHKSALLLPRVRAMLLAMRGC